MPRISSRPIMAMLIVILILPATLPAQSFWLERNNGKSFLLEIFKPTLHRGIYNGVIYPVDYSFETFALFLSLRQPIGSKYFLVAELPFAHAAFDTKIDRPFSFYRHSGASSTIGNPYIGLELGSLSSLIFPENGIRPQPKSTFFSRLSSRIFPEIGIRLPLAKTFNNYASRVGEVVDFDRNEAFEERYVAVKAMINYRSKRTEGLTFRARVGAMILRDTDRSSNEYWYSRGTDLDYLVNAQVGYETARMSLGVNLSLGFTASVKLGNLRIGANCIPLFSNRYESGLFGLRLGI